MSSFVVGPSLVCVRARREGASCVRSRARWLSFAVIDFQMYGYEPEATPLTTASHFLSNPTFPEAIVSHHVNERRGVAFSLSS